MHFTWNKKQDIATIITICSSIIVFYPQTSSKSFTHHSRQTWAALRPANAANFAPMNDYSQRMFAKLKQTENWSICRREQRWRRLYSLFIMYKYAISSWAIRPWHERYHKGSYIEDIADTWPLANWSSFTDGTACCCKQKTKRLLVWRQPCLTHHGIICSTPWGAHKHRYTLKCTM